MPDSYQRPLLDLDGAVAADPPDAGVAAHYGSPATEQRRLVAGEAFVDLSHRDVISITGPDRLTWLHALTTQHVEHLPPGQPAELLLLSPQGRIEHGFAGVDDGETSLLGGDGAVVCGDAGVGRVGLDRPMDVQERALPGVGLRHAGASPTGATAALVPRPPCRRHTSGRLPPARTCAGRRCTPWR